MAGAAEDLKVRDWRRARFLELGFSPGQSDALSEVRIDWHDVRNLIRQGCEPLLAARILFPLPSP